MSNQESPGGVSRRALLKSTALGSLALAAGGVTLPFTLRRAAAAVQQATGDTTRIVWGACSVNCGSRCALRLHVRDDEVVYVETDNTGDDRYGDHQVRACLRGRSIRRRINHPDRLNYPMKRVGKRGEGKFVRISWQEALDTLADRLKSVVAQYGNEAVYINYSSGIVGGNITRSSPSASPVARLMNCYGGSLNQYGTYSTAQIACAMPYTYGSNDGNSTSDIENSKLVVMFGNNPAETRMSGGGITWYLEQARERSNARMIVIDPRYTDTAAGREDEWIPIRPGTDAALVADGNEPEDHFGTVLLLAAWLCETEQDALFAQLLAWHLLPWSGRFLSVFVDHAAHPFYQALGQLAQATLAQWQENLPIAVAQKPLYR